MKRLTLLRHAKSSWDDKVTRDFDRPVNAKGRRAAKIVGQHIAGHNIGIEAIVASPAVRVRDTLDDFQKAAGIAGIEPVWDRRIYLASSATLLDVIRDTDNRVDHLLMVGHNPGIEDLVLNHVPLTDNDPLRCEVEEKYPTATLATLEFDERRWADVGSTDARLIRFVRPRDLDADLGPEN